MSVQPYYQQPALAPQQPNGWTPVLAQPQAPQPPTQLEKLAQWAQAADAAYSVAEKLVRTSFVPESFRGKPHEATAAILSGSEVGLSPMASLQAFHIIQGGAAPKAVTLRAIVQSVGHDVWKIESNSSRAIIAGRRKGSSQEQRSEWTIDRARQMKLPDKNPNWKTQPEAMLIARATSEVCRLVASDAIMGMPYSLEELEDGAALQATAEVMSTQPQEEPKRTARRKTPPARQAPANTRGGGQVPVADYHLEEMPGGPAGPPLPGEEEHDEPADGDRLITKAQLTKLAIELKEAGLTDRDRGLAFMSVLTGREIGSSKDLTVEEASNVIDHLDRLAPDEVAAIIDDRDDDEQLALDGDGDQQ